MIEQIICDNCILGIIIKASFNQEGITFFTPDDFSQQLGYMNRPAGYIIPPHVHNLLERKVVLTQEVLLIKKGKVRVDFYNSNQEYFESRILATGDVILLAHGGHGFEMLEPSEIIEVKQGPYCAEMDKIRFEPIEDNKLNIKL